MKKIVIAIDGFSGCGKSSTAKQVAKKLGYTYIDSGAMYRAATLHFIRKFTELTNPKDIRRARNPFRWSEDFGQFSLNTPTMFFGLGSGKTQPQLHNSNFDFPDTIIPSGVGMFNQIIHQLNR